MAIHEQYPASHLQLIVDLVLSFLPLSTTKRHLLALLGHVHLVGKGLKRGVRVSTLAQDKDKRSCQRALLEGLSNFKHRRSDKLLVEVLADIVLHSHDQFVGSDGLKNDHLLERVDLGVPVTWKWHLLWLRGVKDRLELFLVGNEELVHALECVELTHGPQALVCLCPLKVVEPLSWILKDLDIALRSS